MLGITEQEKAQDYLHLSGHHISIMQEAILTSSRSEPCLALLILEITAVTHSLWSCDTRTLCFILPSSLLLQWKFGVSMEVTGLRNFNQF